jgi:hypothetical protein
LREVTASTGAAPGGWARFRFSPIANARGRRFRIELRRTVPRRAGAIMIWETADHEGRHPICRFHCGAAGAAAEGG